MSFTKDTAIGKRTATCDITVVYTGSVVDSDASSISCSIGFPKDKGFDKDGNIWVVIGVIGNLTNVKVSFNLFKKKGWTAGETQLRNPTFTPQDYSADSPASYPADLWCPAENVIIYTDGSNIVDQVD